MLIARPILVSKHNDMQATTFVNNLLVGSRNIDHRGSFHVLNMATNDTFQCSIKEPIFSKSRHEVGVLRSRFPMYLIYCLCPFHSSIHAQTCNPECSSSPRCISQARLRHSLSSGQHLIGLPGS